MTAPPPDEPDGPRDPGDRGDVDFDAEFERIVAGWGPTQGEPDVADPADRGAEPGSTSDEPAEDAGSSPPAPSEQARPGPDDNLRKLFRQAWGEEDVEQAREPDEHFVPPPAPPIPRPEPRRLVAWAGLLGAPLVGLLLLLLGTLPAFASFLLFCWFVGGFAYLVATMNDSGRDGWDNGAQV